MCVCICVCVCVCVQNLLSRCNLKRNTIIIYKSNT